jgi:hypothetical protein
MGGDHKFVHALTAMGRLNKKDGTERLIITRDQRDIMGAILNGQASQL